MSYTPLWERDAVRSRETAAMAGQLPEPARTAFAEVAAELGEHLRGDFPDVDPALIGWIAVRVSHGLNGLIRKAPHLDGTKLAILTLLAGHHLVEGAS